jgi:hypothetical protein
LRLIATDETAGRLGRGDKKGSKIDGQLVFSSGWEWGYWLNDVVAARSAWSPGDLNASPEKALRSALRPVTRVFGGVASDVESWIVDVTAAERALLIEGRVGGKAPADIAMRSGQAYIQGFDAWDDVAKLAQALPTKAAQMTQPDRLGLVDMRNPLHGGPSYSKEIAPLLTEIEATFDALASRGDALRARVPAESKDLFDDLADAMRMTALRAKQVHGLYDYVDGYWSTSPLHDGRDARLATARKALDDAQGIATGRVARFRVPADRIASWRAGPTAYDYGYLWTAKTLFYWWRDEGKAIDHPLMPCYMNLVNPIDVAFGEGIGTDAARLFGNLLSSGDQRSCLAEPKAEPTFPQDGLRTRP